MELIFMAPKKKGHGEGSPDTSRKSGIATFWVTFNEIRLIKFGSIF